MTNVLCAIRDEESFNGFDGERISNLLNDIKHLLKKIEFVNGDTVHLYPRAKLGGNCSFQDRLAIIAGQGCATKADEISWEHDNGHVTVNSIYDFPNYKGPDLCLRLWWD